MEIKYLKLSDNANTLYQNLGDVVKVSLRGTLIAIDACIKIKKIGSLKKRRAKSKLGSETSSHKDAQLRRILFWLPSFLYHKKLSRN